MRLLRPGLSRRCRLTGAPARAAAAASATASEGSWAFIEYFRFDGLPRRAHRIGRGRPGLVRLGKQNARDARGELRIVQHLGEVVDEMRAVEARDPGKLVGTRALEEHAFARKSVARR